jgi:hypothetical protein
MRISASHFFVDSSVAWTRQISHIIPISLLSPPDLHGSYQGVSIQP